MSEAPDPVDAASVPLFRKEVAESRVETGATIVALSPSFSFLMTFCLLIVFLIVIFLFFFDYAHRVRVPGKLAYEEGVTRVFPPTDGIISGKFVSEGAHIGVGERLFSVSTDRQTIQGGSTANAVAKELIERSKSLSDDYKRMLVVHARDRKSLAEKVDYLKKEAGEAKLQISSQEIVNRINDDYLSKLQILASEGIVSNAFLQEKQQANADIHTRMHALLRASANSDRDLHDAQTMLSDFTDKANSALNSLKRDISVLDQAAAENETKRELIVYSKTEGMATAVIAELGQNVASNQVLMSIAPLNARLYVQLNVPTAAAGMILPGQRVMLRYPSFPYERFGQFVGTVNSIPQTAMSAGELRLIEESKDLVYPVRVAIEEQSIDSNGKSFHLREGMLVDADILLESRRLIEWLVEPILSAKERFGQHG